MCAFALSLSACGGSSSSESASTRTDGAEPSAEFAGNGPTAKLAKVGVEATDEERQAASQLIEESLRAREDGDWARQCETFGFRYHREVTLDSPDGVEQTCEASLENLASLVGRGALKSTLSEPIAAMRIKGNRAYAFYHGIGNKDYVIQLERDGDEWKVASVIEEIVF